MTLPHYSGELAVWIATASLLIALVSLVVVPWLLARLPEDYFCHQRRVTSRHPSNPVFAAGLSVVKNSLGLILIVLGLIMLLTPGQGLLTLAAGLILLDLPGKFRLERWLVTRPKVLPALNWLRQRMGKRPLKSPTYVSPTHQGDKEQG